MMDAFRRAATFLHSWVIGRDGGRGPHRRPPGGRRHPHGKSDSRPRRRRATAIAAGAGGAPRPARPWLYRETLGLPTLRRAAIARHYRETYGLAIDPGAHRRHDRPSSAGFILAFPRAVSSRGIRVAVALPGLSTLSAIIPLHALGCEPVVIEDDAGDALGDHPPKLLLARRNRKGAAQGRADRKSPANSDRDP